jgi:hypothetical protein
VTPFIRATRAGRNILPYDMSSVISETKTKKKKPASTYAIIMRYQTDSAREINKAVTEKFVPRIKHLPGFVAYYGIDSGYGVWSSVSVFDSKADAEASIQLARDFVKENDLTLSSRRHQP